MRYILNQNYRGSRELLHQYAITVIMYRLQHIKTINSKEVIDAVDEINKYSHNKEFPIIRNKDDILSAVTFGVILPVCEKLIEKHKYKEMVKIPKADEDHATITNWPEGSEVHTPKVKNISAPINNALVVVNKSDNSNSSIE